LVEAAATDPRRLVGPRADVEDLLTRLTFLADAMPELGLPVPDALLGDAVGALASGARSVADLRRADVCGAVLGLVSHAQRAALETHAPSHWTLPSGRRVPLVYPP